MSARGATIGAAALLALATPSGAGAASATTAVFGHLPDGRAVEAVTLTNRAGMSATLIGYGASIQAVRCPAATASWPT